MMITSGRHTHTRGQRQVLASVMVKDAMVTGRKSSILG